jgi:hypothetical protein
MMKPSILKAMLFPALLFFSCFAIAQAKPLRNGTEANADAKKPYKVLTNGKEITIQSKQQIKSVMVWTASGHRIVEEKQVNAVTYSFTVPSKESIFFMMAEMQNGKKFTEKIGVK